jgi:catechol 2,3-dioxygenase-like lactoylglutathione lyase family enzyme
MIHHISIPARNPERVARVLGELFGGYAGPFVGAIPDSWVAYAEDANGTGIEVYPERTTLVPGKGDEMGDVEFRDPPPSFAFHALVSVKVDRATIERIGEREGWRTKNLWRGPSPEVRLFELYEFWIENRIMIELATEDMLPNYVRLTSGAAQRQILERQSQSAVDL